MLNIATLYSWEPTLFDALLLPGPITNPEYPDLYNDMPELDKQRLIDRLCWKTAELEVYPADAATFKAVLSDFSFTQLSKWQALYNSYYFKFNPLWNKDGKTVRDSTDTHDLQHKHTGFDNGEAENTEQTAAFDSTALQDKTKNTGKDKQTYNSALHDDGTVRTYETITERGNIGVTKSTELIQDYRKLWTDTIYDIIINDIIAEFCILVY